MAKRYASRKRKQQEDNKQELSQAPVGVSQDGEAGNIPPKLPVCGCETSGCNRVSDSTQVEVEIAPNMGKKWYLSRTLWVLGLGTLGEVALIATETLPLTPEAVSILTFVNAAVAAILRVITKEKLTA